MLIEQIRKDRMQAMKNKEEIKKNLLGTLIGDACKVNKEPSDSEVIATIKKFIKGAEETLKALKDMNINVLAAASSKPMQEIVILESYLPTQLTEMNIKSIMVQESFTSLSDAIKFFKAEYAGRYDGALVSKIAKEMI